MVTTKPGKQRKELYNAPLHKKRKWLASHMEENLILKYDKRSVPVIKGDAVKVMRGNFRGHEDKVANVHVKKGTIEIEGIIMSKADGNKIAKPIHPSNVMITKLNLTDKWRRRKLEKGLSEDAKKEIEKEAEQQIKEAEVEKQRLEEEAKQKELEETEEVTEEEPVEEKPKKEDKPKTSEVKKPAVKKQGEKKTTSKKTTTQTKTKTTSKKEEKPKTEKKTPAKKIPVKKEEK